MIPFAGNVEINGIWFCSKKAATWLPAFFAPKPTNASGFLESRISLAAVLSRLSSICGDVNWKEEAELI